MLRPIAARLTKDPFHGFGARAWGGDILASCSAASNHRPTETSTGLFVLVDGAKQQNQRSTGDGRENAGSGLCDTKGTCMPCMRRSRQPGTANLCRQQQKKTGRDWQVAESGDSRFLMLAYAGGCWAPVRVSRTRSAQLKSRGRGCGVVETRESSLGRVSE